MCGNYLVPFAPRGVNPREPSAQSNMPGELRNALAHGPQSPGSESQQQIQTLHEEHAWHPWRHEGGPPACAQPGQFSGAALQVRHAARSARHPAGSSKCRPSTKSTRGTPAPVTVETRGRSACAQPGRVALQVRHCAAPKQQRRPFVAGWLLQQQFPSPLSFCVDSGKKRKSSRHPCSFYAWSRVAGN